MIITKRKIEKLIYLKIEGEQCTGQSAEKHQGRRPPQPRPQATVGQGPRGQGRGRDGADWWPRPARTVTDGWTAATPFGRRVPAAGEEGGGIAGRLAASCVRGGGGWPDRPPAAAGSCDRGGGGRGRRLPAGTCGRGGGGWRRRPAGAGGRVAAVAAGGIGRWRFRGGGVRRLCVLRESGFFTRD